MLPWQATLCIRHNSSVNKFKTYTIHKLTINVDKEISPIKLD